MIIIGQSKKPRNRRDENVQRATERRSGLSDADVREIRQRRKNGEKYVVLAVEYQVSNKLISNICRGTVYPEVK